MTPRRRVVLIFALSVVAACGFAVWWKTRIPVTSEALLLRLPTQDAVVVGLDFDTLRRSGILGSLLDSKGPQEREYVDFVRDSGFDYQRDLHFVLASFAPDGEFFFIRGTFDWRKLERYVASQHGSCANGLCKLSGSTSQKNISFYRARNELMAMAVAPDGEAAARLRRLGPQADVTLPKAPVWLTFSAGALRHAAASSGSSRLFATALMDAERVTLTAEASASGALEARLEAVCRDPEQAGGLVQQLQGLSRILKSVAAQPSDSAQPGDAAQPDSLGGLLGTGTFSQAGAEVTGHWVIPQTLLTNLARNSK